MNCATKGCDHDASMQVYWPGRKPLQMCLGCTKRSVNVGNAIGCYIHTEPILPGIVMVVEIEGKDDVV